ncbi:MAG: hypothetical protein ACKOWH_01110 [Rhodoluna sp.]
MKKLLIASATVFVAATLSGCALLYPNWGTDQNPSTSQSATTSESASASPSETSASPTPTKSNAVINLIDLSIDSSSQSVSVVAMVDNASEDGGQCVITMTSGSFTKSVTVKAEANAASTQCFPALVSYIGAPKGKATVTISYSSEKYSGTSKAFGVDIP